MEQLSHLLEAYAYMFSHLNVFAATLLGVTLGVILGAIPGLSSTVGIALLIPFTYYMSPLAAISMVYAVNKGGTYGGSIPAILINTPGTAAAACTQLDGFPLTQQGKQGKALRVAVVASAIGDFASELVLIFATIYIAQWVWAFGPVQVTAVLFFALSIIGTVAGKSAIKGLIAALAGVMLSTIGLDPITAMPRFSFGLVEFETGLRLVPVLLGVFVISEIFNQAGKEQVQGSAVAPSSSHREDNRLSFPEFRGLLPTIGRSYLIGQMIGIIPGIGSAVACWIGYGQAKAFSKHPEKFGHGSLEGVAGAEAANNSVSGANMMPLLTLGVPGSTDAALIMSVFLIHGLEFGPRIFVTNAPLVYGIFAAGVLAILGYFVIGLSMSGLIGRAISRVPRAIIYPVAAITAFVGSYAVASSLFDVGVMVFFGVIGYFMKKYGFSVPALVIAFMLGTKFEVALRRALLSSRGSIEVFFTNPISLAFILLSVAVVGFSFYQKSSLGRKEASL